MLNGTPARVSNRICGETGCIFLTFIKHNGCTTVELQWLEHLWNHVVGVVVLLFYVHGKHLRSCRDGQLT